jgi:CBS domain-containing protein
VRECILRSGVDFTQAAKTVLHHGRGRIEPDAMIRSTVMVAIICLVSGRAMADEVWSCSVIEDGKPQVIKFTVGKDSVSMSDWRTRLGTLVGIGSEGDIKLRLIANSKEAIVAVSEVRVNREPATLQETSIDVYAIDKKVSHLTITTANTAHKPDEIKGNCVR